MRLSKLVRQTLSDARPRRCLLPGPGGNTYSFPVIWPSNRTIQPRRIESCARPALRSTRRRSNALPRKPRLVGSGGELPAAASAQPRSARLYSPTPDGAFRSQHSPRCDRSTGSPCSISAAAAGSSPNRCRVSALPLPASTRTTEAIAVARAHAEASGLSIDYRIATAELMADTGQRFDAVLALEIIEHVADPAVFLGSVGALVRPGGAFIGATLNRTPRSFAAGDRRRRIPARLAAPRHA